MIFTGMWMVATATVGAVLVISGLLKVRQPQAVDRAFADLRVPSMLRSTWIRRSFPWLETLLGVAIVILSGPLLQLAAAVAVAVFGVYLALIARAAASDQAVQCNCFGAAGQTRVTQWTVLRNAGLLMATVVVLVGTLTETSSWPAAVSASPGMLIACAPAIGVMALVWKDQMAGARSATLASPTGSIPTMATTPSTTPAETTSDDDYTREPIPRYALRQGTGEHVPAVTLRQLVATGPVLLVRINPGCGPCATIMSQWDDYQVRLGTTVQMLPVLPAGSAPGQVLGELDPQRYLYDDQLALDALFEVGGTPWAVLLGADGWLAGGPELGVNGIEQMVTEIQEVLQEIPDAEPQAQV